MNNEEKEIVEITGEVMPVNEIEDVKVEKKQKKKFSFKNLSKNQKIFIIAGIILLLIIIAIVIFFVVLKDDTKENIPNEEPLVVIEKSNYRYENGELIFLNNDKDEIGRYTCNNASEETCTMAIYETESTLAVNNYLKEDYSTYTFEIPIYSNRYALILDEEKVEDEDIIIIYDFIENKEIGTYKSAKAYKTGEVILKNSENKYGIMSLGDKADISLEFKYDYLGYIPSEDNYIYKEGNTYGVMDNENKSVYKGNDEILSYTSRYVTIKDGDYKIIDYKNNITYNSEYTYVTYDKDFIYAYTLNKLYLKDLEFNNYYDDGIDINEKTDDVDNIYVKNIVLDDSANVLNTIEPFEMIRDESFQIKANNKTNVINLYEYEINKRYNYVNYSNGKLYFYEEENKDVLDWVYTCNNKNKVTSNDSNYLNCFIPYETDIRSGSDIENSFTPIYQNHAFIMDKASLAQQSTIYLYDIANDKRLAPYTAVDLNYLAGDNINKLVAENVLMIAKNTAGKHGILLLGNGVSAKTEFKYTSITELSYPNNYLSALHEDGYYDLYNEKGNKLNSTSSITVPIIKYANNHVVVESLSGGMSLYTMAGQIAAGPYDQIEISSNILTATDNNKLEVYRYNAIGTNIINKEIIIEGSMVPSITKDDSTGFSITITDQDQVTAIYNFDASGSFINEEG